MSPRSFAALVNVVRLWCVSVVLHLEETMRSLAKWMLPLGLASMTLLGTADTASAQVRVGGNVTVQLTTPRVAPPTVRVERVGPPRRGYVWVSGNWDWRNNRYVWVRGHYERSRAGMRFRTPNWVERDGAWVRVDGTWDTAPQYPDQAPPDPREERIRQRRGFIYVKGHWDWQDGQWNWIAGRYEREKAGSRWNDGRWEQRDDRWQWSDGGWEDGAAGAAWTFDSRGMSMMGEKIVEGHGGTEQAQIDFSQKQGRISKLTVVVLDSDLEMLEMKVVYVSGKSETISDKQYFREDTRTRVVKLDPNDILRAVQFKYSNLPGGGHARVQMWGNVK